jgi:hypothetical protein
VTCLSQSTYGRRCSGRSGRARRCSVPRRPRAVRAARVDGRSLDAVRLALEPELGSAMVALGIWRIAYEALGAARWGWSGLGFGCGPRFTVDQGAGHKKGRGFSSAFGGGSLG